MTCHRHSPVVLAMKVELVVLYVPLPLTVTCCVKAGVPEQVASAGLNRLKVIVPPAFDEAPLMVASSFGIRFGAVVIPGAALFTTSSSVVQSETAALLLASPE